jgi:hypothetical protein
MKAEWRWGRTVHGNKREVAMSSIGGPYSLTLHVLTTLLIIELQWGIAVFIGLFFSSIIVFYAVCLVGTAVSLIGALYNLRQNTPEEGAPCVVNRSVGRNVGGQQVRSDSRRLSRYPRGSFPI